MGLSKKLTNFDIIYMCFFINTQITKSTGRTSNFCIFQSGKEFKPYFKISRYFNKIGNMYFYQ